MTVLDGTSAVLPVNSGRVTMAITNAAGTAVVEQSDGSTGWFPVVIDGTAVTVDATNTMVSIYCPVRIRVTPTGTDVIVRG